MRTLACSALLLLVSQLPAYELVGAKFESTVVTWSLAKSAPRVRKAVEHALRDWSEVSPLIFVEVDSGADIRINFDPKGGPANEFLATTLIHLNEEKIVSADIIINARDYRWFGRKGHDLRSVISHEIGHALGLEHSPDPRSLMHGTFVPGEVRTFSEDDIVAIVSLYGNIRASQSEVAAKLTF